MWKKVKFPSYKNLIMEIELFGCLPSYKLYLKNEMKKIAPTQVHTFKGILIKFIQKFHSIQSI